MRSATDPFLEYGDGMQSSWPIWAIAIKWTIVSLCAIGLIWLGTNTTRSEESLRPGQFIGLICLEKSQMLEIVGAMRVDPAVNWHGIVELMSVGSPYPVCQQVSLIYDDQETEELVVVGQETFQIMAFILYQYLHGSSFPLVHVYYGIEKATQEARQ